MQSYRHVDLTFDVHDSGPRDGEPVILLHGYPQDAASWHRVVPLLTAAGMRTIAPDMRGYSPGARPAARRDYTIDKLVGDVIALMDAAGLPKAHVAGHDWGGGVAWATAIAHPDRVASLTAIATPHPEAMRWAWTHSTQGLRSWYMGVFQLPWLPEQISARAMARTLRAGGLNQADAERYQQRFADPASLNGPINYYRALPLTARPGATASRVRVPTTYLWGTKDQFLGRAAALKTAEYVDADYQLRRVAANHWLPEQEPAQVADAILDSVRRSHPAA